MACLRVHFRLLAGVIALIVLISSTLGPLSAVAQVVDESILREAARRSGMSREDLLRQYQQRQGRSTAVAQADTLSEPGRIDMEGIDDREAGLPREDPPVTLPEDPPQTEVEIPFFGADLFELEAGLFLPPSFGPVPADYLVGIGDEIVVDVWGEVEFRLERIVDRDGSVILPRGGKVICHNRTLAEVESAVRARLAAAYSGIGSGNGDGSTFLDVSLGRLRSISIFVVGDVVRPGAYELSSLATVFSALYAAGGPGDFGSLRDIRLMRGAGTVARLDVYDYLMEGIRTGDAGLREGDTVFVPPRGKSVQLQGAVRRPLGFEMKADEDLSDLLRFGGGLASDGSADLLHIVRILPPDQRHPEQPDRTYHDVYLDPLTALPIDPDMARLHDGDVVTADFISDRDGDWVEIRGNAKHPARYAWTEGLTAVELILQAGGLWPDTFYERALIDREDADGTSRTIMLSLGDLIEGRTPAVELQSRDSLRIFSIWEIRQKFDVAISGEVRSPGTFLFREGMTLGDLILRAGGLLESADQMRIEVFRVREEALQGRQEGVTSRQTVTVIPLELDSGFLGEAGEFRLEARDQVSVRSLPWWETQRMVTVRGEVYYPGLYSLERSDQTLSELIERAGGLKPTAFRAGARVTRQQDGVGNIAIELGEAMKKPGSVQDIVLAAGDELYVPERPFTVKVVGEVGFTTSLVHTDGSSLGDYINRAGGFSENADKWRTRVVYPNGSSKPIRRIWSDPKVLAGSTIVVPAKAPDDGSGKLETMKEISAILASVATVWLVIDRTSD